MQQALVERAKKGDREAFDALAREVGDRCMAIAFRILRDADRAEDAVQAALISAWRQLRTLRDPSAFEPWLHRILTNECYAEARRRTRMRGEIRLIGVCERGDSSDVMNVNDRDQLDRAFRRLTLEQRAGLAKQREQIVVHRTTPPLARSIADRLVSSARVFTLHRDHFDLDLRAFGQRGDGDG